MVKKERNPDNRDGFCKYCGKTGLHPQTTVCGDSDCEPSDHIFKECENYGCRNIFGPVPPEKNQRYCSESCAAENIY